MVRPLRFELENTLYLITACGNERRNVFIDDEDYAKFLSILREAKDKFSFLLYSYVLMPNHYHLLIQTTYPNIGATMHFIQTKYTVYFNIKNKRVGHLFQGRYKSLIVDKENFLLELIRYTNLNPIRAGLAEKLSDYKWVSYNELLKSGSKGFLESDEILKMFSSSREEAWKKLLVFFEEGKKKSWSDISGGFTYKFILGKENFVNEIKKKVCENKLLNKEETNAIFTNKEKIKDLIMQKVCNFYNVRKENFFKTNKRIRNILIYLLKTRSLMKLNEISVLFPKISYSHISKITSKIQVERTKNKNLNKKLQAIESEIIKEIENT